MSDSLCLLALGHDTPLGARREQLDPCLQPTVTTQFHGCQKSRPRCLWSTIDARTGTILQASRRLLPMSNVGDSLGVEHSADVPGVRRMASEGVQPHSGRHSRQVAQAGVFICCGQSQREVCRHSAEGSIEAVTECISIRGTSPQTLGQLSPPAHTGMGVRSCSVRVGVFGPHHILVLHPWQGER